MEKQPSSPKRYAQPGLESQPRLSLGMAFTLSGHSCSCGWFWVQDTSSFLRNKLYQRSHRHIPDLRLSVAWNKSFPGLLHSPSIVILSLRTVAKP